MSRYLIRTTAIAIAAMAIACTDSKTNSVDSLNAVDTVKPLGIPVPLDSPAIDSTRNAVPPTDSSAERRGVLPPPGGETYRRGSTLSPRDQHGAGDPPPNLIGETRKQGGTMGPSAPPTSGRDSSYGPKLTVDANGNVVPIKR